MLFGVEKIWNDHECEFADEYAQAAIEGRECVAGLLGGIHRERMRWWWVRDTHETLVGRETTR